ncbi:unnamed protein product, partial [Didymodactylos carnosus]
LYGNNNNDDFGEYQLLPDGRESHWEVVERILFVYCKLNVGQGYVQGMNEIIDSLYYTFATDLHVEWREHAEADCFYCFTNLMVDIRDNFIKVLDNTAVIHNLFERLKLKPEFDVFRWLTLLLSQEFHLPDVMRLWDSLFANHDRNFEFLLYICCAMIILQRNRLLNGNFSINIKLLQAYEYCLHSLESCENNVRRLCQDQTINIPYPENDPNRNVE